MRLRELLDSEELGLRLLVGREAGDGALDRAIRAVPTVDLADPGRFLTGGELVLSELAWWREDGDAEVFVRALDRAGVTALAAGEAAHGFVPQDLVRACRRRGLPLVAVRPETSFTAVTEHVLRRLDRRHVGDLAAVVERHRQLLADRGAPDSVLELLRHSMGLEVRVLSVTGRQIAGAGAPLHAKTAAALAGRYLAARGSCEAPAHRVRIGDRLHSLVPVPAPLPEAEAEAEAVPKAEHAAELGDWLLVVEADTSAWPAPDVELLDRIVELVGDARAAHDGAKVALNDLARRLLDLLYSRVPPEEIPVRLSSTAQAVVSQKDTWQRCQFVVARGERDGGRPIPGPALRALLEEALVQADGPVPVSPQDIAATVDDEQAVLFVLVPEPTDTLPEPALDGAALQRRLSAVLTRWLGPTGRVSIGVSTPVAAPGNARRALGEARTALRVADAGPERVTVRGPEDLTSRILSLLLLVPAENRQAFASRLLGPLRDHDSRHRTDLVTTLEAFLDCDGSWTRCADRLHLHVNSLRQRVARIEHLTGRDLSRLETRLDFLAALKAC
ncbi:MULTISPECIES: PucR family transcriptional regulator [unclassified Streptomyces]|uniref:PucR family transcriptional regulator n=1 Tax=unclassified Streptomyces TaxID=2593676 RepID=UPI000DC78003|nr:MULTISPECIES: PucR family transcriptional regulator [unclassified Streptomyces]AWZ10899.1 PucR family transcriptional regulator [Streptomyces sp. ICC4]AWZ18194.1 PucR family transcriptional regulator [Streptomyces sp. ICC1]